MSTPKKSTPTKKLLKQQIDTAIALHLQKYKVKKISEYNFTKFILGGYPSWYFEKYAVKLYKNGKTCKVSMNTEPPPIYTPITAADLVAEPIWSKSGPTSFKAKPFKNPMMKKTTKVKIMEGKLAQLVTFHLFRKHTLSWETCLACKATRAFIQWEFHQPWPNNKKVKTEVGIFTKKGLMPQKPKPKKDYTLAQVGATSLAHPKLTEPTCITKYAVGQNITTCNCGDLTIQWQVNISDEEKNTAEMLEVIKDVASSSPKIKDVTFKDIDLIEKEANFLEDELLFEKENEDFDGSN